MATKGWFRVLKLTEPSTTPPPPPPDPESEPPPPPPPTTKTSKAETPAGGVQVPVPEVKVRRHLLLLTECETTTPDVTGRQSLTSIVPLALATGVTSPAKLKARVSAETRTALKRDLGVFRT
jgi:hypothetical protein